MMISAYHIGPIENVNKTYEKMFSWAEENGYKCGKTSIERYVTDYWTINNNKEHVTEVLIEIEK